ncbi:MAG: RluA family pseudouridine synthase [Rickettsiales bacterium]|jgi:23S rRNA pseudouridine955/2504/2580 synthase|nr:RluA family pseudouridine synthase [Rickettsiales bacterium]
MTREDGILIYLCELKTKIMEIKNITVNEKIYKFLQQRYSVAFGNLQKFFRSKSIKVNGGKISENYILQKGDVINLNKFALKILSNSEKKEKTQRRPSQQLIDKIKKSMIFEDEKILAINKPSGLSAQGGSGIAISLDDVLPYLAGKNVNLKLVHRLDKDTSGVLVIAKGIAVAEALIQQFKEKGKILKTYLAVVYGRLKNPEGIINLPLLKRYENDIEKVFVDKYMGKEAITKYKTLVYNKNFDISLLEVTILTGRTHQIRVHLKEIGNPVVGDFKYGNLDANKGVCGKMLLHSHKIQMELDGKAYNLHAPVPASFKKFFAQDF